MVRFNSSVCNPAAGSLLEDSQHPAPDQAGSLFGELAFLFGDETLKESVRCNVRKLDFTPSDIVQAARELRRLQGMPSAQKEIAQSLPHDIQVALCRWMLDFKTTERVLAAHGVRLQ